MIVVVGAGVIGASIAYHLARAGAAVTLADRGGPGEAPSATWASAGGLRSQGRHAAEQPLTRAAAARWATLPDELDADLELRRDGHLHVAETDAEADTVAARVAADRAGGIAIALLQGAALREAAPALTPRLVCGAFTAGDGQAHPGRTARAFAAAAVRAGARLHRGEVFPRDGGVEVDGAVVAAERVVLATGAWSVALAPKLPLRWRGLQMALSEVAAPALGPTVTAVGRNLSLKQGASGQFMLGGRWIAAPAGPAPRVVPVAANVPRQWAGAVALLPRLADLTVAQTWAGAEAQSADGLPFIGPAGGVYLATGFSGHGFQLAPAVGDLVAGEILGERQPLLAPFRPDRPAPDAAATRAFLDEPLPA